MADPKRPTDKPKPSAAAEPASKARAEGIDPKAVYIGGESLADRLMPHAKKFLYALGALTVILSVYFVYRWWSHRKAEKGTTVLLSALEELHLEVKEPDPDAPAPDPDLPPPPRTFATEAERTEATLAKLAKVSGSHRSAVALLEAQLLIDADRAGDADAIYQRLRNKNTLEGVLAREGLAYNAEAAALALEPGDARNAALQGALELYRAVQPEEDGPRREVALYNEGRVLALLGDKGAAKAIFQQAIEKDSTSAELESIIQVRLSQLEAKEMPVLPPPGAAKPEPEPTPEPTPAATDGGAAAPVTPDAGG